MSERNILSESEILQIAENCEVVSVAFFDTEFPYVLPLNFGLLNENGKKTIYFHGAKDGRKMRLIKNNNKVSFCMYGSTEMMLNEVGCKSTMKFESVCGTGLAYAVEGEEKQTALQLIMRQYCRDKKYTFDIKAADTVAIWKIEVLDWSGKTNKRYVSALS